VNSGHSIGMSAPQFCVNKRKQVEGIETANH